MYCLSRFTVLAPDATLRPALFNLARGTVLQLKGAVYEVLLQLGAQRLFTESEFHLAIGSRVHLSGIERAQLLSQLCELGIVWTERDLVEWENSNRPESLSWEQNGWASAKQYHDSVVYSTFLQGDREGWEEQVQSMEDLTSESSGPPPLRTLPAGLPTVALDDAPESLPHANFFEVILGRRTLRSFTSPRPITRAMLSAILFYAAKAQHQYTSRYFGVEIRRTSPSGGARHPVDLYPQIFDSEEGLDGNYYYDHLSHRLVRLGDVTKDFVNKVSQQQVRLDGNFVVFLVTVRFARHFWKYRYPKSYSFSLLDVGHFVQTLILVCEAFGLKCFLTPALDVRSAQHHLLLPNIYDECPVYFVAAGYEDPPAPLAAHW